MADYDIYPKASGQDPQGYIGASLAAPDYVLPLTIPAGATGNVDFTGLVPRKVRVLDAWLVKTTGAGGGAGSVQVMNGATANAITDAMSINIADTTIARATTINDANYDLAAGATIRVVRTRTASTAEDCIIYLRLAFVA